MVDLEIVDLFFGHFALGRVNALARAVAGKKQFKAIRRNGRTLFIKRRIHAAGQRQGPRVFGAIPFGHPNIIAAQAPRAVAGKVKKHAVPAEAGRRFFKLAV